MMGLCELSEGKASERFAHMIASECQAKAGAVAVAERERERQREREREREKENDQRHTRCKHIKRERYITLLLIL